MIEHIALTVYGQKLAPIAIDIGATINWDFSCQDPDSRETLDLSPVGTAITSSLCRLDGFGNPIQPPIIPRQATITDAPGGKATVPWANGDTVPGGTPLTPGFYYMDLWIGDGNTGDRRLLVTFLVELRAVGTLPATLVTPLPPQAPLGQGQPGTVHAGVVAFATGGSGDGFDFVDVAITPQLSDTSYKILLTAGSSGDILTLPEVHYTLKAIDGFRIRPQAQFDGEASWAILP